jgi:hypothetical protein
MNLWNKIILILFGKLDKLYYKLQKKDINYHSLSRKRASNLDYRVDDFGDILFHTDNQKRENIAILKLLRSPYLWFLCNETYSWVAVNIPLNLCGGNFEGDIDILIAMLIFPPRHDTKIEKIYRAFEVKTTKINKKGIAKSLKISKFEKIKNQLNKIIHAGSQQTFLLEIFILEADYSLKFNQLPKFVTSFIDKKVSQIKKEKFGYNCIFLEQQRGFDEEKVGVYHRPMCLKGAEIKKTRSPIKEIIETLEDHWEKEKDLGNSKKPTFIAYCRKCKKLNTLYIQESSYKCKYCKKDIF